MSSRSTFAEKALIIRHVQKGALSQIEGIIKVPKFNERIIGGAERKTMVLPAAVAGGVRIGGDVPLQFSFIDGGGERSMGGTGNMSGDFSAEPNF